MIYSLEFVHEPSITVEWIRNNFVKLIACVGELKLKAMNLSKEMSSILTRLFGYVYRYIFACGNLETLFSWMQKGYMSPCATDIIQNLIV